MHTGRKQAAVRPCTLVDNRQQSGHVHWQKTGSSQAMYTGRKQAAVRPCTLVENRQQAGHAHWQKTGRKAMHTGRKQAVVRPRTLVEKLLAKPYTSVIKKKKSDCMHASTYCTLYSTLFFILASICKIRLDKITDGLQRCSGCSVYVHKLLSHA